MGSHFLTLHVVAPEDISSLIKKPESVLRKIQDAVLKEYAKKLMKGDYERDPSTLEHPEGHLFVRAFKLISELACKFKITLELYEDDEETPELWNFIWSQWEPREYFPLPRSPYGVPAVTYKGIKKIPFYLDQFKDVRERGGYNARFLPAAELESLISTLDIARKEGRGVFVFLEH